MIKSKIQQAINLLNELNIDMWMLFCRETEVVKDPSLDLMVGDHVSGKGAFIFTRSGDSVAYVWLHDASNFKQSGYFNEVKTYENDFKTTFLEIINKYNPRSIALNYSKDSSTADGITYGMYLKLLDYFKDTPYEKCLISAEKLLLKLRSVKTSPEIEKLTKAATVADSCWHEALQEIKPGLTEIEIANILTSKINKSGYPVSFGPIVNAGTKSVAGHGLPTNAKLEKGDLLHVDFGAKVDGYCSDLQRVAYFKKDSESSPPNELISAFHKVKDIIDVTSKLYKPNAIGKDIDEIARKMLKDSNYPEYQHSLGHQIGREVHDGGSRIGPFRDEGDITHLIPLDLNNAFTVELGINIDNIGYIGLEEDLLVTANGGEFLCSRQMELNVI